MLRANAVREKPIGPHIDQCARDALDDRGLVANDDVAVGAATNTMEVVW